MIRLTIPWPPSVNAIWRQFRGRTLLSKIGRAYRQDVAARIMASGIARSGPLAGALDVSIDAHQPDRRRRDTDNLLKAPLDALTHARLWVDDSQLLRITITKRPPSDSPRVVITIKEYQP